MWQVTSLSLVVVCLLRALRSVSLLWYSEPHFWGSCSGRCRCCYSCSCYACLYRQQQYDKNLERIMVERGFSMSPVPYLQKLRQPLAVLRGDDRWCPALPVLLPVISRHPYLSCLWWPIIIIISVYDRGVQKTRNWFGFQFYNNWIEPFRIFSSIQSIFFTAFAGKP